MIFSFLPFRGYMPLVLDEYNANLIQFILQPVKMMEDFLRLARENTQKNLETCGVLAGSLVRLIKYFKNHVWALVTLLICLPLI